MLGLGEELAGKMLSGMPPDEARVIVEALQRLGRVDGTEVDLAMAELAGRLAAKPKAPLKGDAATAERLVRAATRGRENEDELTRLFDLATPALSQALAHAEPAALATLLRGEHPQTIALTLAHLTASACAATIKLLPHQHHTEVLMRIARLEPVDPEVVHELALSLKNGLERLRHSRRAEVGGAKPVAQMLGAMDPDDARRYLDRLEEQDPALADTVRALMFTFEDLARLEPRGLQEVLAAATEKTLVLALKTASSALSERIFAAMSERRATRLRDDLAALSKTPRKDVEAAQRELAALARQMVEEGRVSLVDAA